MPHLYRHLPLLPHPSCPRHILILILAHLIHHHDHAHHLIIEMIEIESMIEVMIDGVTHIIAAQDLVVIVEIVDIKVVDHVDRIHDQDRRVSRKAYLQLCIPLRRIDVSYILLQNVFLFFGYVVH